MDQSECRKRMIAERKNVSPSQAESAGEAVAKKVLSLPEIQRATTVMVYLPVRGEIDTLPLIRALKAAGKTLAYPVTVGQDMVAAVPENEVFVKGDFGVSVPQNYTVCPRPDGVIVPLTAADMRRYRVGYGKGYYDRFLAETGAFSVGVCYHFQIVEKVNENPWEKPLNVLVSEQSVLR